MDDEQRAMNHSSTYNQVGITSSSSALISQVGPCVSQATGTVSGSNLLSYR